ncbi:MAG: hypothetical protein ACRDKA_08260 [Actinomycetota bacterium]
MKRGPLLAAPPAEAVIRVVREIAESLRAGLELAWLLVVWIALHVALGALALGKVVLLVVRSRSPRT